MSPCETHFVVAPRNTLYTAKELNEFMDSLVPELKADKREEFTLHKGGGFVNTLAIYFGKLTFTEKIGECRSINNRKTISTITDEKIAKLIGYQGPKEYSEDTDSTTDTTWDTYIRPYPNELSARLWSMDVGIPVETLKKNLRKKDLFHYKLRY